MKDGERDVGGLVGWRRDAIRALLLGTKSKEAGEIKLIGGLKQKYESDDCPKHKSYQSYIHLFLYDLKGFTSYLVFFVEIN